MLRVTRSGVASALRTKNFLFVPRIPSYIQKYSTSHSSSDDVVSRIKVHPIKRVDESLDKKRARLVYQSRKRGILETDLLLSGFAAKYLKDMTNEELDEYDALLNELDWDIYYWVTKNYKTSPVPERWRDSELLKKLQEFSENKEKKILRMPDLENY